MSDDVGTLALESFAPHVGTAFRIEAGVPGPVELELTGVRDLGTKPRPSRGPEAAARTRAFAVYFRGPMTPVLPQRIYELHHAALGVLPLFIVPIGPDGAGMGYEAIFN